MKNILFALLVRPVILFILGLNIRRKHKLPDKGPCVIIANHNSHLDTLVLMSLFRGKSFAKVRPVAAGDYFMKNKFLAFFSTKVMNIIPIERKMTRDFRGMFKPVLEALDDDGIIILFPEGSRGEAEQLSKYKSGIYYLMREKPEVPIVPLFIHGLGKALPKGSFVFVPFFVDIFVGDIFFYTDNRNDFMVEMNERMDALQKEGQFSEW
ncbi:lysophospholipid acyltransferase family protein [Jeotgalicoccus psychrophilus]|uniref:lysophospholipid acyltransferase family protein n=1 Tax=Jeotgalicoccus psychrophilus TaxID=157228 RepID=UPI0004264B93|nr:lysophospholipid acyltransferase family protein [Jeotgalicoccus psychrophilus]